jgi:hypothetical protein
MEAHGRKVAVKDFSEWLVQRVPWLVPIFVVLSLTFLVVPSAAQKGYQELIGAAAKLDGKAVAPFSDRSPSPRQDLWAEIFLAASEGGWSLLTIAFSGLAFLFSVLRFLQGDKPISWMPHRIAGVTFLAGCVLSLIGFAWSAPSFIAPQRINAIGEELLSPKDFWELQRSAVGGLGNFQLKSLYSWLHGVDPRTGRTASKAPDWRNLRHVTGYFYSLCRWSFYGFLWVVALSSLASGLLAGTSLNSSAPIRVSSALLIPFLVLLASVAQWIWLAEDYGRLQVAPAFLESDPNRMSSTTFPFSKADSTAPPDATRGACGTPRTVTVRSLWPVPPLDRSRSSFAVKTAKGLVIRVCGAGIESALAWDVPRKCEMIEYFACESFVEDESNCKLILGTYGP